MSDTAVKTNALEAGIKSLAVVGDRLVQLAADDRLDDDREVIGDIAAAMTNVRAEVTSVSRKLDVVQRDSQQREYERDVAREQAREAEGRQERSAAAGRMTMQLMAAGCVVACLATGFAARWWYAPVPVVAVVEQRAPVLAPLVPLVAVVPVVNGAAGTFSVDTSVQPQATGDYTCAFGYGRQAGCPEDVRPAKSVRR